MQNFNSLKKLTSRAVSYILDTPQQHPSLVAYGRYTLPYKYKHSRPDFLDLDKEAIAASADHEIRPVMHPKRPLLMATGYAEVINAGKTFRTNEDQSCLHSFVVEVPLEARDETWTSDMCQIPCIYFAIFDGHAGTGAAMCAYKRLHHHVREHLTRVAHMLVLSSEEMDRRYLTTGLITKLDTQQLVVGALEHAFQAMDEEIRTQRYDFRIEGGCTALVALSMQGKLFVANAGDCRAVVYRRDETIALSHDHTPETERRRVQEIAAYKPSLLCNSYTRYQFQHRCRKKELGTHQLYRDYNMSGWSLKTIDKNDMRPQLVSGEGKRARLLDTIGTTRGFGDHDLEVAYCPGMKIKPFMTCAPDVQVFSLEDSSFTENDVLVMASDGLWEKLSNERVRQIIEKRLTAQCSTESRRYVVAAQGLVDEARGAYSERGWRTMNNEVASYDDISVFVIPLHRWKQAITNVINAHRLEYGIPPPQPLTEAKIAAEYEDITNTTYLDKSRQTDELDAIAQTYEQVNNVEIKVLDDALEKKKEKDEIVEE